MEDLTLTTPISVTTYRVHRILMDWPAAYIEILVAPTTGEKIKCTYAGQVATTLMTQLNTINLTTSSLHKRILERLVTDGKLPAGTVTGAPD